MGSPRLTARPSEATIGTVTDFGRVPMWVAARSSQATIGVVAGQATKASRLWGRRGPRPGRRSSRCGRRRPRRLVAVLAGPTQGKTSRPQWGRRRLLSLVPGRSGPGGPHRSATFGSGFFARTRAESTDNQQRPSSERPFLAQFRATHALDFGRVVPHLQEALHRDPRHFKLGVSSQIGPPWRWWWNMHVGRVEGDGWLKEMRGGRRASVREVRPAFATHARMRGPGPCQFMPIS